jgi:hypothetical protein
MSLTIRYINQLVERFSNEMEIFIKVQKQSWNTTEFSMTMRIEHTYPVMDNYAHVDSRKADRIITMKSGFIHHSGRIFGILLCLLLVSVCGRSGETTIAVKSTKRVLVVDSTLLQSNEEMKSRSSESHSPRQHRRECLADSSLNLKRRIGFRFNNSVFRRRVLINNIFPDIRSPSW